MPKVHNIGPKHFVQFVHFPVKWGAKLVVTGWTQEIEFPYRSSTPLIFRLPFRKAVVIGKWTGQEQTEEDALNRAIEGRVLSAEDFDEEKGWIPVTGEDSEEGSEY